MKDSKKQITTEQEERIRMGELAKFGLESDFWLKIVKPILDSLLIGANDVMSINISSDKKASIELAARKLHIKALESIPELIKEFVIDADTTKKSLEKQAKGSRLYRNID